MRLFSEKVTPTYTRSAVNILTVEDFQEIFYDVYELVINKKKFIAEKVTEYKGAPVVEIPVIVEGVEETLSFVLAKGKFEVLVGRSTGNIPVEENYQTPRTIRYSDKGNTVEEIVYDSSESLTSEIKSTKDQLHKYEENTKLEGRINRHIADCKQELYDVIEEKYDDSILTIEKANVELRSELQESLSDATNQLQASITLAESKIKKFYDEKITLLEESLVENKPYFLDLVRSSKQSVLKETESIKNNASQLISENNFAKNGVDLKGIKSELEKLIGTRFSNEMASLKRLIELSSGGGSVAKQFAKGGFMDGNLTVNGLISAQNLTITGTISTTMLEALSANIRYLDINTYELSGFHSTGNVDIDGNLTVTETITGRNLTIADTISTTTLNAISANIKFLNIDTYELSGFHSTGDVSIDGNLSVSQTITAQNITVAGTLSTTMLEALSANITYIDIKQYELSGFDVTGDVDIDGNLSVTGTVSAQNLTITGTISATMLEALSANIRYLDINTYELSGFHSTGNVDIDGNLTVSDTITAQNLSILDTISAQNLTVAGTISATMLEALSANIRYLNINTYELSGFDVSGDVNIDGNLTVAGVVSGSSYINDPTGRVIIVDNITGTDTRTGLIKYDQFKPFKSIEAAVIASATDDTIYIRAGTYTIVSQIPLDGKGNIYFETGAEASINGTTTAFSLTANETKLINGSGKFTLTNTAGILSQANGNITLEYNNIDGTSAGTLFNITGGTLNTSFISINSNQADGFVLTGSGSLIIRNSYSVTCNQFLNCNTSGSIAIDLWQASGASSRDVVNVSQVGSFTYKGTNLAGSGSCIAFSFSAGSHATLKDLTLTTTSVPIICKNTGVFKNIFLDNVKLHVPDKGSPSLSSYPSSTTIYSTATYGNVLPHSSVTVDGQYNLVSKFF
jgi:cytoskeletal protein CcmA (bactofilin family)